MVAVRACPIDLLETRMCRAELHAASTLGLGAAVLAGRPGHLPLFPSHVFSLVGDLEPDPSVTLAGGV